MEKDIPENISGSLPSEDLFTPTQANQEESSKVEDEVFDQDLVEAFLEMEDCLELVKYFVDMDKVRFKEIAYVLYQAFKQRNSYLEVKKLFETDNENPLDFNEAIKITTELIDTTGRFKKLSKYVRVQLIYGLDLVRRSQEEAKVTPETMEYIEKKWKFLKPDCLRQYAETTGFFLTKEMIIDLIHDYESRKKVLDAIDIIQDFELFDIEFDWESGIKTLIDTQKFDVIMDILDMKNEYIEYAISLMSTNKLVKYAANIIEGEASLKMLPPIDRMGLDINDYPDVQERLAKKTTRWYLYNYSQGPKHKDYLPLWKLEDLFSGYDSLLVYIIDDL